jgi:CheY-like chemotaxis protein
MRERFMQGSQSDVLLVVDMEDDAELLTRALVKRRPGTRVTVVHDGVEAVRKLHGGEGDDALQPRLIVLDLHLPSLDGIQILRCLTADKRTAGIPIVVLSGTCSPEDVGASRSYGAKACIRKPHSGGDMNRLMDVLTSELH